MILTNETVDDILRGTNERFKLKDFENVDIFSEKTRKEITIEDIKDNKTLRGIITFSTVDNKTINTKEFKEI